MSESVARSVRDWRPISATGKLVWLAEAADTAFRLRRLLIREVLIRPCRSWPAATGRQLSGTCRAVARLLRQCRRGGGGRLPLGGGNLALEPKEQLVRAASPRRLCSSGAHVGHVLELALLPPMVTITDLRSESHDRPRRTTSRSASSSGRSCGALIAGSSPADSLAGLQGWISSTKAQNAFIPGLFNALYI